MKKKALVIFLSAFVLGGLLQGIRWVEIGITDDTIWADQAERFQTDDPRQFDEILAYGHPGGPLIEGTIAVREVTGFTYHRSLIIWLTVFNALLIAAACVVCFALRRDYWWLVSVFGILSLERLFNYATPPSASAALLVALLALLTLYLYEHRDKPERLSLISWSVTAGLAVATRTDIGEFSLIAFGAFLSFALGWKRISGMILGAFAAFCVFDPYMWFMPLQHAWDLVAKIVYHYADYAPSKMLPFFIFDISSLALVSVSLAVVLLVMRNKMDIPLPSRFVYLLLGMTAVLYHIFLTAPYQAPRYFQPILLIWEIFLPLFLLSFVPHVRFASKTAREGMRMTETVSRTVVVIISVGYPAAILANLLVS